MVNMKKELEIINGGVAVDDRGSVRFINDFNFDGVKRFYQVANHKRDFVTKGSALVGAVNLKNEEITKHVLSAQSPKILYIPPGYANGFKSLEEDTIILFFSTSTLEDSLGDDIRFPYDKWNIWEEDYR
jgi:dTDP-4-dehydrorhamnose 3,5-epimerase